MSIGNAIGAILFVAPVGLVMWGGAHLFSKLDDKMNFSNTTYAIGIRAVTWGIGILGAIVILLLFFNQEK